MSGSCIAQVKPLLLSTEVHWEVNMHFLLCRVNSIKAFQCQLLTFHSVPKLLGCLYFNHPVILQYVLCFLLLVVSTVSFFYLLASWQNHCILPSQDLRSSRSASPSDSCVFSPDIWTSCRRVYHWFILVEAPVSQKTTTNIYRFLLLEWFRKY